jgi:excinuclease ABC A subunit
LVNEVFAAEHPEAVRIDQSAVTANARSNPGTFTGVMDRIRQLFAAANSVSAGLFSYNSEGACANCKGMVTVKINLSFMDVMETPCEVCGGIRFRPDVLEYRYKDRNIAETMGMTIVEAADFFEDADIRRKLRGVCEVGLGYMTLGQPLNTLSGGECQRLKLARELGKKGNLYILDEPTTGLHLSDVEHILLIIDRLVKAGNTVVVVEHHLDVIRRADWIVDLGPDGGNRGGEILYEGPPAGLLSCVRSVTARYI